MLTSSVHAHFTCPRILPIVQSPGWRNQTLFPGFKIVPYVVTRSKWLETGLIESLYVVMWIFSSVFFFSLLLSCLILSSLSRIVFMSCECGSVCPESWCPFKPQAI